MADARDAVWLSVLPDMKNFGGALVKGAGSEADKAGKSVGKRFGTAMVAGVAVAGAGLAAAGAALYKVGEVFDDVTDTIRTGTGATGKALDGLVATAKNVGSKVPADFSKIGTVVADVNTRMGLSGGTLEKVASQYLEAGRILGEDVDISKTSAAFNAFKIEGDDVSGALDHLFQVSQATGLGMNELAEAAARNAPAMQTLGFSFEETTAMVGSFDKAGLNSSQIMASMSKGLVTLAKDGEQPAEAFKRVQGEISGFIKSGDEAGALNLASKVFGTRGATQFIGAIKSGTLNLDDMSKAAGQTGDSILGVGKETMDFAEQWQLFKNKVLVWLEPMAAKVFGGLAFFMGEVTAGVTAFGAAWAANDGDITSSGIPGMFEQFAYWGRQAFDYVQGTALPAVKDFGTLLSTTFGPAIERIGNFIRDTLLPNVQGFGGELGGGTLTAVQNVGSFLVTDLIPTLGKLSIWLLDNADLMRNVGIVIGVIMLPALVRLGVAALVSGAKQVAGWTMAQTSAIRTGVVYVAQSILMIGRWAWMGVQALFHAGRMALAWMIAMGPIGWVIAAVVGLAAVVIANWDKISTWTRDMWNKHVKPVFDNLANFITKDVPDAFKKGVKWIGEAWAKLKDLAKAPVKFVVETIINRGLIDGLNTIGGFLKLPKIPHVPLPKGFHDGGYTGPGRKKQPAGIVHAGEVVFSQDDIRRHGGVAAVENLRRGRGQAAIGSSVFGGVPSFYGPQFRAIDRADAVTIGGDPASRSHWFLEQAAQMWNGLANVRVQVPRANATQAGIPYVHTQERTPPFATIPNWAGYYMGSQMWLNPGLRGMAPTARRTVMAHEIGHALGLPHAMATGKYSIMNYDTMYQANRPTAADAAALRSIYGAPRAGSVASSVDPDQPMFNPLSGLVDELMKKFKAVFTNGGFIADLAMGIGKKIFDDVAGWVGEKMGFGQAGAPQAPALYDQGGVLPVGLSQVVNRTRKPEAILNPQQWSDIHKLAVGEGSGGGVHFHGNVGWDPDRVAQEIEVQKRRSQTMAGMGGVVFA